MSRYAEPSNVVNVSEAKAHFSRLLDRVGHGESIFIARHAEPVARLVPFSPPIDKRRVARAIKGLVALRKKNTLGGVCTIEDLINDGRTL